MPGPPQIAVVVPTRNRVDRLHRVFACLAEQTLADFAVVVVDDSSTDDTGTVLEALAADADFPVDVARTPAPSGAAAARNIGWRRTSSPLVAFTDDDCRPEPGWLAALIAGFTDADVVQGVTRHDPGDAIGRGPFSQIVEVQNFTAQFETSNVAYRRELLETLGGFDEHFEADAFGEDVDLGWRALESGARTVFAADAVVVHDTKRGPALVELRDSLLGAWRWRHIGRVLRDHPGYRAHRLHRDPFLMATHPPTWTALAGLGLLAVRPRSNSARVIAAAAFVPWVRHRLFVEPRPGRRTNQVVALPAAFAVDAAEALTVAYSGFRYGTPIL